MFNPSKRSVKVPARGPDFTTVYLQHDYFTLDVIFEFLCQLEGLQLTS